MGMAKKDNAQNVLYIQRSILTKYHYDLRKKKITVDALVVS